MTDTVILYHKNCADGTAAALAAYQYFGENAFYIPVQYQEDPPDFLLKEEGKEVFIVDFSYPREVLNDLVSKHEVTVLDHHKTAKDDLLGYGKLRDKVFDMERSGAMITWSYFHPEKPIPKLFHFIQDRDLWKWKYEETKPISAYLQTVGFNHFRKWTPFLDDDVFETILEKGNAIAQYQDSCVKNNLKQFYQGRLPDGTVIWMNNCSHLISETCSAFLKSREDVEVCCCWFVLPTGKITFSFRSKPSFDCSVIAKRLGGGGHHQASGCKVDLIPENIPSPL
jgi:oligoribonuclease NrnB/cAMP/cGMP phosphodiesterase (DHH superfamily)